MPKSLKYVTPQKSGNWKLYSSQELNLRELKMIRIECLASISSPLSLLGSAHFFSIFQILPVGGVRLWPGV